MREAAKSVAVFPNVIEFGFIVAGKGGPGMVSCRDEETGEWGESLSFVEERNTKLYGEELTPEQVLFEERAVPEEARIFTDTLTELAPQT